MPRQPNDRVLTAVVFTDIVGSTEIAREMGDDRWKELLRRHHALIRAELKRLDGREVDNAGDGFFAAFSSRRCHPLRLHRRRVPHGVGDERAERERRELGCPRHRRPAETRRSAPSTSVTPAARPTSPPARGGSGSRCRRESWSSRIPERGRSTPGSGSAGGSTSVYRVNPVTREVAAISVGVPLAALAVDEANNPVWVLASEA